VTNLAGVDLSVYRFDHDLTFAVLLMNADGTVYHRYGSRESREAEARLSLPSLVRTLEGALETHALYAKDPHPPAPAPRRVVEEIPTLARKLAKRKQDCMHCHFVYDAERSWAQEQGTWKKEDVWRWPPPAQVGLELDRDDQPLVGRVAPGSAAAKAGVEPGDRLLRLGAQRVLSEADVRSVLEATSNAGGTIALEWSRGGEKKTASLVLETGWRVGTPLTLAWRPSMWALRPNPGFGGKDLTDDERAKLGLAKGAFAFEVGYLIDWGDDKDTGKNAAKAGIQKGDIVVSAGGKTDFDGHQHFQAWFRLTQEPGKTIEIEVIRGSERKTISLAVLP
jgi:serine protease Do